MVIYYTKIIIMGLSSHFLNDNIHIESLTSRLSSLNPTPLVADS